MSDKTPLHVTALYAAVLDWLDSLNVGNISRLPGVWRGETRAIGSVGPIVVRVNGHKETVDGIPPYAIDLAMHGLSLAVVGLRFGMILPPEVTGGIDEQELIAHFKAQVPQKESESVP